MITVLYYWVNNALYEFYEIQLVQIPLYARNAYETEPSDFILANIIRLLTRSVYTPLLWLSVFAFIYFLRKGSSFEADRQNVLLILIWFAGAFASLIVQWKFFLYHFIIIIPPLVAGTALFIKLLLASRFRRAPMLYISSALAAGYLFFAGKPYYKSYGDLFSYVTGESNLRDLYIKNGVTSDSVFTIGKIFQVTEEVNKNSMPGDKIYIWGIEPLIYYLSGRDCASRFTYNTPLFWKGGADIYRSEFLNEINRNKPTLILVAKRDPMYYITGLHESSESVLKEFPEFLSLLESRYHYLGETGEFGFYKLN